MSTPQEPTVVNPPPPPPPTEPGEGVGLGMLLTIGLLAAAAATLAVLLVTRHHNGNRAAATAPTVASTTQSTTAPTTSTAPTTTAPTTTAEATTATVPSLSGDLQSALQAVRAAGFAATVHYVPSSEPRGTVVAQSPSGGASASSGSQVTINVSAGTGGTQSIAVPSAVGMSVEQAVAAFNAAGLHLVMLRRRVTDQSQAGKVISQTPAAGAQAPKNSRVVVYMGAYTG